MEGGDEVTLYFIIYNIHPCEADNLNIKILINEYKK